MRAEAILDRLESKASAARTYRDRAEASGDRGSLLRAQGQADAYDEAYQIVLEAL